MGKVDTTKKRLWKKIGAVLKRMKIETLVGAGLLLGYDFNRCRILMDLDEEHPPILTYRACASKRGITMTTVANTAASCQRS